MPSLKVGSPESLYLANLKNDPIRVLKLSKSHDIRRYNYGLRGM